MPLTSRPYTGGALAAALVFLNALPNTTASPGPMTLWPWQYGIANALTGPNFERVTLQKGTRLGFTALCGAYIGLAVSF